MLCILKKFLTEYTPEGENTPVRDLSKIANYYLYNGFVIDFILWIPLNFIGKYFVTPNLMHHERDLLIIKIYRLIYVTKDFDVCKLQQWMI